MTKRRHLKRNSKRESLRRLHVETLERRELLAAEIWQPLGPFSADNGQVENVAPTEEIVGAIHTVLAHPTDPNTLYIGATNGGVWKTTNAVVSRPNWTPLTDDMPSSAIGAMIFDRADPNFETIYAGTGRFSSFGRVGGDRVGLMRTIDGGDSWEVVDPGGTLRGKNISGVYANGDTIVVSVNTADSFNPNNVGIFRSDDGGDNFDQVSVGDGSLTGLPAGVAYDLFADPIDKNVLYTSSVFSAGFGGGQVGVYKSPNQGESWTKVSNSLMDALIDDNATNFSGTSNLEITVGNSDNVFVSIINSGRADGIFRSGDGGASWVAMDTPATNENGIDVGLNPGGGKGPTAGSTPEQIAGGQGTIHFSMVADPINSFVLYAGGDRQPGLNELNPAGGPFFPNSIGANDFSGRLFRGDASQPLGSQWVHLTHSDSLGAAGGGTASSSAPHADSREMVFDATGNIIEVDDGGIYRRTIPESNQGDWISVIGDLLVTEPHDIAYDAVSDIAISGNQDTGTTQQPTSGATIWESISTGDGGDVVVDDVSLAGSGQSIRYSSFQNLGAFRKRTYDSSGTLINQVFPNLQVLNGTPIQPAFRTPVELNSVDPNQLVFQGRTAVYESFDQGDTLFQIPVAGNAQSRNTSILQNAIVAGGVLNGLANDRLLWVGSGTNLLGRTPTSGMLTPVTTRPPVGRVRDLTVDSQDWNSVFVADEDTVAMSNDAGDSWVDITADLLTKASSIWSLMFVDGPVVDAVLAGTNLGIFATAIDALGTWIPVGDDLPNVPAFDMELDTQDDVLVSGMLGRGTWLLNNATQAVEDAILESSDPNLIAVAPNSGDLFDLDPQDQAAANLRMQSPTELVLTFGGPHALDPQTLDAITVQYSETGSFAFSDAVDVPIGFIGLDDSGRSVTMRFAENLGDGFYQLSVTSELTSIFDVPFSPNFPTPVPGDPSLVRDVISFELELGAKVTAIVAQPIDVGGTRLNDIDVYFDDADMGRNGSTVEDPSFYQLIDTQNTVTTEDDTIAAAPTVATYDDVNRKVTLTFANLETIAAAGDSLRLRIGDSSDFTTVSVTQHVVADSVATDPGLTFATANTIPVAGSGDWSTVVVGQQIRNATATGVVSLADNPGGIYEPGHRDIEVEDHYLFPGNRDFNNSITTIAYSFARNRSYGTDSGGQPLFNQMNAEQEKRFLEILDIYSSALGIDFYEVDTGQGLRLIVGDLSTADPTVSSGPGGTAGLGGPGGVTMDALDFQTAQDNEFGGSFFNVALHEIGHAIGLGHSYDLPPGTVQGSNGQYPDTSRFGPGTEWAFPGDNDIVHGAYLHQKESQDVDLYRVNVAEAGVLKAQTFAQRLPDASLLDTSLTLYRLNGTNLELISANEDYFGSDSFMEFAVEAGTYVVGVASEGNTRFDPDSGLPSDGGTSEGSYELRVDFTSESVSAIRDADGSLLDGDRDGVAGGNYNFWFEPTRGNTIYVNKAGGSGTPVGTLADPFTNIPDALTAAKAAVDAGQQGVVVRLLPNGGSDLDVTTQADNIAYEVGFVPALNQTLEDGRNLELPGGIHLVVDAGVIMKFLDSRISIGSDDDGNDRSEGTISVQGTPDLPVYFTSYNDRALGSNSNPLPATAASGDWGGIEIRNDVDRLQGRVDAERLGIFQNYVNHAEISFGGGEVSTLNRIIDPIHLSQARAEVSYNTITSSSDAAMSADPNTFGVTTFTEPRFQKSSVSPAGFVTDYDRKGPNIYGNILLGNSTNGIFVRIDTPAGGGLETLQVSARLDDTDIVHVLGENLLLDGAVGGPVEDSDRPDPIIGIVAAAGGTLTADDYQYSYTYVDEFGFESPSSTPQTLNSVTGGSRILLTDIPAATGKYVARRLYRSDGGGAFVLVAELDKTSADHVDDLETPSTSARILDVTDGAVRHGRIDGSLIIDPGTIIKNQGARIQLGFGSTLLAEGLNGKEIIFTARGDDRFGAGGTFDTDGNGTSTGSPADWAGIYASPTSRLSIDNALVAFAGGETGVNGGTAAFNPIQIHQAEARIANTMFEDNADGLGLTQGNSRRDFAPNDSATVFVTAAQPTIINNTFIDNAGAVISINVNAMNAEFVTDLGRQTGNLDVFDIPPANNGPVFRGNRLADNEINGLDIRGEVLTTEVVWDDTDIVHVLQDDIEIPDLHTFGGMRLESSSTESLVVKANGAEILATGRSLDITDRIGGRLVVVGQPGFPVVITSLFDNTVGAGFTPQGFANTETETTLDFDPRPGDWQGLKFDNYSHDRNLAVVTEREGLIGGFGDANASIGNHQELGLLAGDEKSGDENIRLGFTTHGAIADDLDQDLYSFEGIAGTMVWLDIDRTDPRLDTVLELIDGDGRVLALSQNSRTESLNGQLTFTDTALVRDGHALPMQLDHDTAQTAGGEYRDLYTTNDGDSGMRVVLTGATGTRNTFYVRVRSSDSSADYTTINGINASLATGGTTHGGYQLQVRIQEIDEHAGSTVRYADLRYATSAIVAIGLPAHSPIAGDLFNPGGLLDLGNLSNTDRGSISIAGVADNTPDTYTFNVGRDALQGLNPTDNSLGIVIDVDWADGLTRPNTNAYLYNGANLIAIGTDSNVSDDRITPIVPGQPTTEKDLSRGSHGIRDAFIGPLELNPGGNYQVVIGNDGQMPADMAQFTRIAPPNTNARLEPLDSIVRIADDRFDFEPNGQRDTPVGPFADIPQAVQVAFDDFGGNIIPWQFGDLPLITVSEFAERNGGTNSQLNIYNPFTGRHDAIIDENTNPIGAAASRPVTKQVPGSDPARYYNAVAIERPNSGSQRTDGNTDTVYAIDVEGTLSALGTTGIQTYENFNNGDTDPTTNSNRLDNEGMRFASLAYYNDTNSQTSFLYGLANRGTFSASINTVDANGADQIGPSAGFLDANNLIYLLNPDTGAAIGRRGRTMPGGFESANPTSFFLRNNFGGNNNQYFPSATPWAGTDVVAQVQIPNTFGNVTSIATDTNGSRFLYAFTDGGAVYRMIIVENSGGLYGAGDLLSAPELLVHPLAGIVDSNGNTLAFEQVTPGPANFSDVNDSEGIANLHFAVGRPVGGGGGGDRYYAFDLSKFSPPTRTISFSNFNNPAPLTLVGTAAAPAGSSNALRLNPEVPDVHGAGWFTAKQTVSGSFETFFDYQTTGDGSEGFAFVIQNDRVDALGASGNGLGYEGVPKSLAIEFDTFEDIGNNDPDDNHVSVHTLGSAANSADEVASLGLVTPGFDINDGSPHQVRIVYQPGTLTIYLDNLNNPAMTVGVDLESTLNLNPNDQVWLGFTGASGSTAQSHDILNWEYTFLGNPVPTNPIFEFGADSILVGNSQAGSGVAGMFFTSLDKNLWHTSDTLRTAAGHGMGALDDRANVVGGGSLRFGFDNLNDDHSHLNFANIFDNTLDAEDLQGIQGYNVLGGAHGGIQSNSLDLSSFSENDLPTLYFTYLLDSENTNADSNPGGGFIDGGLDDVMRDSLRVSVAGEDGTWHLVATNNMDDSINGRVWEDVRGSVHEYDPVGSNGYTDVEQQRFVQELFDDDVFRQARIDLGPWAGQEDVQIRFEFSTAGEARPDQSEIHALRGEQISDGHQLTISGQMPERTIDNQGDNLISRTKNFEFDLGLVVQMPAGSQVAEAGSIALKGPGSTTIVELVTGPASGSQVSVLPFDTAAQVAQKVITFVGSSAVASTANPAWVGFTGETTLGTYTLTGADNLILSTPGVSSGQLPILIDIAMSDIEVRDQIQLTLANEIHYFDSAPNLAAFPVVGNTNALRIYDLTVSQSVQIAVPSAPGNDSIATAQNLDGEVWTLIPDARIQDSTSRPHLTIQGTGDGTYDYFSFTVDAPGSVATFDIESVDFDTELHLYDPVTGLSLATDDDSGAGFNSFIQHTFDDPGTYVIGVASFNSFDSTGGITGNTVPAGANYTFHVSVDSVLVTPRVARPLTLINGQNAGGSNTPGAGFGVYSGSTSVSGLLRAGERSRAVGGANGVYVDDIVIGLADRGESFTGSNQGTALVDNPYFEARKYFPFEDRVRPVRQEVTQGEYQLDVRLGREYLGVDNDGKDARIGINERLADGFNIQVASNGSQIVDGDTFEISNGSETLRFEWNDITIPKLATPTTPGNVVVNYRISDTLGQVADSLRTAINSGSVRAVLGAEATSRSGESLDNTDPMILLHGYAAADNLGGTDFTSPESGLTHLFGIVTGRNVVLGEDNGDSNVRRDQGVFIVDSNTISFSSGTAIDISAGPIQPGNKVPNEGNRPKPGSVQNFATLSGEELVHGAVVQNNLLISNRDGIVLSGNGSLGGPFVYSRILNNTVFNSFTGITIADQAAPTLLNNVLVFNGTGIRGINEGPTVIRATVYDGNFFDDVNGVALGTEAIVDPVGPLFVNPSTSDFDLAAGNPNLYPAAGSALIDSSIESQLDRTSIVAVKDSVGIPQSPILVTERDLAGQLRRDGSTSSGQGQNINIDRGALDRSDTIGPQALLIVPTDNDAANIDIDRNDTFLQLTEGIFNFFEILITEDAGIGPDRSTITPDQIIVFENGQQLIPGINVIISYNNSNRTLRIQSPSGIWRPDGVYEIVMLNQLTVRPQGTLIEPVADLAGNSLQPNRADGQTRFTIVMPQVELDFGDAPDSYGTLFASDGARHTIVNTATPRFGDYIDGESDSAGVGRDDDLAVVTVDGNVGEAGDGPFTVTPGALIKVELTAPLQPFDNLAVTAGNRTVIFEMVKGLGPAAVNRVPVNYPSTATPGEIMDLLSDAMQASLLSQYVQAVVDHTPGTTELFLEAQDDEDGVSIGAFDFSTTSGTTTINGVFLDPITNDLLSFLNPSASNGAELVINTVGGGFVDAWIDYNGDGDFLDQDEQVLVSEPVVDGENRVRLNQTPANPAVLVNGTGTTQARFRLNGTGDQSPSGLEIGGEVEDYQVFIADAPVPEPFDETVSVTEDIQHISAPDSVRDNDSLAGASNLQYVLETNATNGSLLLNPNDGTFTYTPDAQFYGEDSFTYRITGEQVVNGITLLVRSSQAATVTLNVAPTNDPPLAFDSTYVTTEPSDTNPIQPITITSADLLIGAGPHEGTDTATILPPFDESEQQVRVVDIHVVDVTGALQSVIVATDPLVPDDGVYISDTHLDIGGGTFVRTGTVTVTVTGSEVESVEYVPAEDYNRNNPLGFLDRFEFTVADDGVTTKPNGLPAVPQPAPETVIRTASLEVQPQNDPPIANDDLIPSAGLTPGPQEDVPFTIPLTFLTSNDFAGPVGADDENAVSVNVITGTLPSGQPAFPLTTALGGTVTFSGGNLVYTSDADYSGPDSFEYFIFDDGIDIASDGTVSVTPKFASATVFLTVTQVNDAPSAFDQSFVTLEDTEITGTPSDLLGASQGDASPQQPFPLNEGAQITSISALVVDGVTIDQSNYDTGGPFLTQKGGEVRADFAGGILQTWTYIPGTDFNEDIPVGGGLDAFDFIVQDDGVPTATATATASILVNPRNDAPVLSEDIVSASGLAWNNYFAGLGQTAPVPTEDTPLTIPIDFILGNDFNGPVTAGDELDGTNDGALTISPLPITTALGGSVTFLPTGDLQYNPPANISGTDTFTYTVSDAGIDSDLQGNELIGSLSTSSVVSITVVEVNDPPILDTPSDVTMPEDTLVRSVVLTGLQSGPNESQVLDVTVVSNDLSLLPTPTFIRTSPSTGLISLTPVPDQSGVTTITVILEDGGDDNNLSTTFDNLTATETFVVRVTPVNDAPTLSPINDLLLVEDDAQQTVNFSGIDAGGGETQDLGVIATSDNPALLGNIDVTYTSPGTGGSISFTPIADQSGTATITVTVEDAGIDGDLTTKLDNATISQSFVVTVGPVNDPPNVVLVDLGSFDEGGSLLITQADLLAGSSDVDGDSLTAINLTLTVGSGTLTNNSNGTSTFDPPENFNGAVSFSFDVDDGTVTVANTANLTINAVNDAPDAVPVDLGSFDEDGSLLITQADLLTGSSDIDGDSLTAINLTLTVGSGTLTNNSNGTSTFDPPENFNGAVSFSFDIDDGTVTTANTASVTVNAVNDAPSVASIDLGNTDEDNSLLITQADLLSGSSDIDGDSLTAVNLTLTIGSGILTDNLNGTFTFDPTLNFNGAVSFNFDVDDGTETTPNTASLTINSVNDAPDVVPADLGGINEGGSLLITQADLLTGSTDVEGDSLTAANVALNVGSGTLVDNNDGTATFTPEENFNGPVSFSFDIDDGTVSIANTANLTVNAVNDAPDVAPVNLGSIGEDGSLLITQADLLTGSSDIDGDSLTAVNLTLTVGSGTLGDNGNGSVTFTPAENFNGAVSFGFDIDDGTVTVANTANLTVNPVNDAPESVPVDLGSIDEDGSLLITQADLLTGSTDIDGDSLTAINLALTGGSGTLTDNSNGTSTFTPTENFNGTVSFSFDVDDGTVTVSLAGVASLTVNAVNDAPVAVSVDLASFDEDTSLLITQADLLTGSSDVDGDSLTAVNLALTAGSGTLAENGDGSYTFTPTENFNGAVSFSFDVDDGTVTAANTANVTVNNLPDPPAPVDDLLNTNEDDSLTIDESLLLQNDLDPDLGPGSSETLSIVMPAQSTSARGATVTFDETTGQITFDPSTSTELQALSPNQVLQDSFTYGVVDADGEVNPPIATVFLNVLGINDAPTVVDDLAAASPATLDPVVIRPLDNDSDVDGTLDHNSVTITQNPQFGTVAAQVNTSGELELTYTPSQTFTGDDAFRYTIADNRGQRSAEATVTIEPDLAPVTSPDSAGGVTGDTIVIDVLTNDVALEGQLDQTSLTIVDAPSNGQAFPQADGTINYVSDASFVGTDTFQYTISDTSGNVSAATTVTVQTVESGLQNPLAFTDVNASGDVTALDALLIINRIADSGGTSVPVQPDDRGPNFFDVNGSMFISALDALLVINDIGEQAPLVAGELVGQPIVADMAATLDKDTKAPSVDAVFDADGAVSNDALKLIDVGDRNREEMGLVDLLAEDRDSDEKSESEASTLNDLAILDLL